MMGATKLLSPPDPSRLTRLRGPLTNQPPPGGGFALQSNIANIVHTSCQKQLYRRNWDGFKPQLIVVMMCLQQRVLNLLAIGANVSYESCVGEFVS